MTGMDARTEIDRMTALYGRGDDAGLRVPPQSVDAEQAVLGGLLLSSDAWPVVSDMLGEADFYRRDHGLIWRAVQALATAGKPHDAVTVADWLDSSGLAAESGFGYVVDLANTTPGASNVRAYAEIVRDKAILRRLITAGTEMVNDGFAANGRPVADLLNEAGRKLSELQPAQSGGLRKASESLGAWFDRFTRLYHAGSRMTGLPTPWSGFNEVTHGLQPATLYLVAARPSMGKSVFGLNLAMFTALRGHTTGVFSLEMSEYDCHNRNVSALAEVPHDWLVAPTKGDRDDEYSAWMTPAIRDLKAAPLYLDDTASLTLRQFEARARRMHQRQPLELLVVDHIHDFRIDPKMARFEFGAIAQAGKSLAKEWNIPVVMLAQLNRNVTGRADKRPTLGDLRESGELEQKGDVIAFLHREDYYDTPESKTHLQGVVELHFAKGRNIRAGERVNFQNRFDVMRLDDWRGELPQAPAHDPKPAKARGFSGVKS